jgi:sigma-B regulation protein RsbU (phosphoserine phosphatase)
MHLSNAGHLPPLRVVKDGLNKMPLLKGLPVGIDHDFTYRKVEVNLEPREGILFLTDGITEAENRIGERFGDRRVEDCIKDKKTPPWGSILVDAVRAWRGNAEANDDLTILEIWR